MTTNPKIPRQSFKKYSMKRAEAARIFSRENSLRKEGKTVRKLSERIAAVTWFITAC